MEKYYQLTEADEGSDYHGFWQLFDNYIVESLHRGEIDDHILSWYLSDDYRADFYRRLTAAGDPLHLILIHEDEYRERKTERTRSSRGMFSRLFGDRMKRSDDLFSRYPTLTYEPTGRFAGFLLYEWSEISEDSLRVSSFCMADPEKNSCDNRSAWSQIERYLHSNGVREIHMMQEQNTCFWERIGFRRPPEGGGLVKRM